MKHGAPQIAFERLIDLVEGRLAPDERERLEAQASPADQATMQWIRRVLGHLRADASTDAPPAAIASAVALMRPAPKPQAPGLRERITAALGFDSRQRPLAFGVRSGQASAHQLLFHAGDRDIDLRLTPETQGWAVSGQILGPLPQAGTVLLEGGAWSAQAALSSDWDFALPPAPPGTYTLTITMDDADIQIPGLELEDAHGTG